MEQDFRPRQVDQHSHAASRHVGHRFWAAESPADDVESPDLELARDSLFVIDGCRHSCMLQAAPWGPQEQIANVASQCD